jgi:D-arabinose 1-dehydrogenase-like Zn-dependent alcohol dehydrogenase
MNLKMKAAQISKPGGDWELVERDMPEPGVKQVRVKVEACGICHSDFVVKEGLWPGLQYPRVPGHEVAGASMRSVATSRSGEKVSASA